MGSFYELIITLGYPIGILLLGFGVIRFNLKLIGLGILIMWVIPRFLTGMPDFSLVKSSPSPTSAPAPTVEDGPGRLPLKTRREYFRTIDDAAVDALMQSGARGLLAGDAIEFGGLLFFEKDKGFFHQIPVKGRSRTIDGVTKANGLVAEKLAVFVDASDPAKGFNLTNDKVSLVGSFHIHPETSKATFKGPVSWLQDNLSETHSVQDIKTAVRTGLPEYLLTPTCVVKVFEPEKDDLLLSYGTDNPVDFFVSQYNRMVQTTTLATISDVRVCN